MRQYRITNNQAENSARQSLADQAGGGRNIQVISKDRSYGGESLESLRSGSDYVVMVDGRPTNMTLDDIRPYIKDEIGIKDVKEINRMYEGIINKGFGGGADRENTYSEDERQGQIKYVTDMMRTMQPKVVNRYAIKDKDGNIVGYSQSEELDKERKAKGFTTEKNADYDPQAYKYLQRGDSYKIGANPFDEVSNARGGNNQETVKNLGAMLNAARAGKYVDPRAYNDGKRVVFPAQDRINNYSSDYAMNKGVAEVTRSAEGDIAKRILAGLAGYGGGGASRPASSQELTPAERKLRASLGL